MILFRSLPFFWAGTRLAHDRYSREVSWMNSEELRHKRRKSSRRHREKDLSADDTGILFIRIFKSTKI